MHNDLLFDVFFSNDSVVQDKVETTIVPIDSNKPKDIVINTPLFDITLKNSMSMSHMVRPGQFLNLMLLDAIANKLVIQITELVLRIQASVIGEEATVGDNPTPVYLMFDAEGNLLPEYNGRISNPKKVEAMFAEADAHVKSALALVEERNKYFPHATQGLQFAFEFNGAGRIEDLKSAIAYQRTKSASYTAMKAKVHNRQKNQADIQPTESLSHAAMLGF